MNVDLLLVLHAIFGFITLASGALVMFITKGDVRHKVLGYTFVISVIVTAICGSVIAIHNEYWFFIHIALATLLQIVMGLRVLNNKKLVADGVDKTILVAFTANALVMLVSDHSVTLALGVLYSVIVAYQVYLFSGLRTVTSRMWLSQHISHMIGAFISMVTAFIVGNIGEAASNGFWWVLPAIMAFPVIRYFKLKYAPDRKILGVF